MKQFGSQSWPMIAGAAILLLGAYTSRAALAQSQTILGSDSRIAGHSISPSGLIPTSPQLKIIQGRIIKQQGKIATVLTPSNPACGSAQYCPAFMKPGEMFEIDTSKAVFQAADGSPTPEKLKVGQFVIAAGTEGPSLTSPGTHTLLAQVIGQVNASAYAMEPVSP